MGKNKLDEMLSQAKDEYLVIKRWVEGIKKIETTECEEQNKALYDALERKQAIDFQLYPTYRKSIVSLRFLNFIFEWRNKWDKKLEDNIKWYDFISSAEKRMFVTEIYKMKSDLISF